MRKLKHIFNWAIWSMLTLYLVAILLVHIPAVQSYLGRQLAGSISESLGTEVSVGRVDLGFLNRLIIEDVVIKDRNRQDLLTTSRMTAKVDLLALIGGKVRMSSAQLFGAHLNLYRETADAQPNYQFVIDSLSAGSRKDGSAPDLQVNSLIIRHSTIDYHQKDADETPGLFNVNHIRVSDISAYLVINSLTGEGLDLTLKRLALKEQSGLVVSRLAMHVTADSRQTAVSDFHLEMPRSRIVIPRLTAAYDTESMDSTLTYVIEPQEVVITPADLTPLWPQLARFDHTLTVNAATVKGTAHALDIDALAVESTDRQLSLQASTAVTPRDWRLQIATLHADRQIVNELAQAFPGIPDAVRRLGDVSFSGLLSRDSVGRQSLTGLLKTDLGTVDLDFALSTARQFDGWLKTDGINLQPLLQNDRLGIIAADVHVHGQTDDIHVDGIIPSFVYRDYTYRNIEVDGDYRADDIKGHIRTDDPNIRADIDGRLSFGPAASVRLTGFIDRLSPQALHLSNQWGGASFSAVVDVDLTASRLNDAQGSIDLDDFSMTTADRQDELFHLDNLHVKTGYEDGLHFVKMNGDMGEAELTGEFDWATLPQSFINYVASKLPTLPGLPMTLPSTDNNFTLRLRLTDTDWMQQLLGIPLTLHQDLQLDAVVDDDHNDIQLYGSLPSFTYDEAEYVGGRLQLTTDEDTAHVSLQLTKLLRNNRYMDLQATATAADNTILSTIAFANRSATAFSTGDISGAVNTATQLYTNEQNKSEAQIHILPSHFLIGDTQWQVDPGDVLYSEKRLVVDNINLHHGDHHLTVNGAASDTNSDTLVVDLNDIDVEYVLNLANFHSVNFGGQASGKAYASELFGDLQAMAELDVRDFTFEHGDMGNLNVNAYWNREQRRVDLHAVIDDHGSGQTYVNGYIAPADDDIDLLIDAEGTPIMFCNHLLRSFLQDVEGRTYGEARIIGPLSRVNMTGDLAVNGTVTMKPLNTAYTLQGDTLHFEPDAIIFDRFHVADAYGHRAQIDGQVGHRSFKRFTYDLDVDADNLLAYNYPDFGESTVCGVVYATGHADIHGRPGEVTVNCDVTPGRGSVFSYNAANPDAVNSQQFITWRDEDAVRTAPILLGGDESVSASLPSDIHVNFRINATPDATLRVLMNADSGDNIALNGHGVINASYYNKGPFQMFGTYTTDRGTYTMTIQNIIRKNFNFQEDGTIVFGGNPLDAAISLNAIHTVNGVSLSDLNIGNSFTNNTIRVNCLMKILGTAGSPRVEFDLEMPTVNAEEQQMIRSIIASEQEMNQQVVYLLGIGRFYTQEANNAEAQQYGQTELAMQSLLSGTVSTQINELLSKMIKTDDWNIGANISTGNEGWHNAEYEGLVSGSMLNNRLLVNGQFGYRDNATQATPSFIGDFDLRYLLTPNGNLALKVYNQTNDRYFTRSSLNTQGIGLILKKDFDGLGDLFHARRKSRK